MKIAFYLGSFNPWHDGHEDIMRKAAKVFDKIVVMQLSNPGKPKPQSLEEQYAKDNEDGQGMVFGLHPHVQVEYLDRHDRSAFHAIGNYVLGDPVHEGNQYAMIRGLRNEQDFCQEQILQDIYEDMGLKMPVFFIISDRQLRHYSSTMIKGMNAAADMDRELDRKTFG